MRHKFLFFIVLVTISVQGFSQRDTATYSFSVINGKFNGNYLISTKKLNNTIAFYQDGLPVDYKIKYLRGEFINCIYYKNGMPWDLIKQNDSLFPIKNPNPLKNGNGILIEFGYNPEEWNTSMNFPDTEVSYLITCYRNGLKYGSSFEIYTTLSNLNVQESSLLNYYYYETDSYAVKENYIPTPNKSLYPNYLISVIEKPIIKVDHIFQQEVIFFKDENTTFPLFRTFDENLPDYLLSVIKLLNTKNDLRKFKLGKTIKKLDRLSIKTIKNIPDSLTTKI